MTFEIEIEGRTRSVSVERLGADRYRMVLDGQAHVLSAARVGAFGYSLILEAPSTSSGQAPSTSSGQAPSTGSGQAPSTSSGQASREVHVAPTGTNGELLVHLDGQVAGVTMNGRTARRGSRDATGPAGGEQKVVAPMPGRIVKVLVCPGDEVAARQGVVVVEAMKMENELRAPRPGRVREVSVSPGASVEAGRVLVVLE
jgi:biotin carboxyl carrier protein